MTGQVYKRNADLMEADLGDEIVALHLDEGTCFGFNEVAAWVWRRLAEPATFDQLRDELLEKYDVSADQCGQELRVLVDDLVAKKLLTTSL